MTVMTPVHVVGVGLDGATGLSAAVQQLVAKASLLVGSDRHLSYFPDHPAPRLVLGDLTAALVQIRQALSHHACIVILVSGDPLFFGLGRLLLAELPPEQLTFHPHLSAVQMAFNRLKVPWQDARLVSAHGRSLEQLVQCLQQGVEKIAVLTDPENTPGAIARLVLGLDLPVHYQFWVCENLGGPEEQIQALSPEVLAQRSFSGLNLVVLLRTPSFAVPQLPCLGVPDQAFLSFADRPGLMTKREVRVLALGELALHPDQTVWDVGAGTGAVAIEIARLTPRSQVYAVEKTALGTSLIQQNCQRLQVNNLVSIHGRAPDVLAELPDPDRVFVGGSGGAIDKILDVSYARLKPQGVIVIALATLEHFSNTLEWIKDHPCSYSVLQVQLSRSVPVGALTRLSPLNPVSLLTICPLAVPPIPS